jgi:hypothetical protein
MHDIEVKLNEWYLIVPVRTANNTSRLHCHSEAIILDYCCPVEKKLMQLIIGIMAIFGVRIDINGVENREKASYQHDLCISMGIKFI